MQDNTFIEIYDDIFPEQLCDRLIERHKELMKDSSVQRGCGHVDNGARARRDFSFYFERDAENLASEVSAHLSSGFERYVSKYPTFGMFPLYSNTVKVQLTEPKGGFHNFHFESSTRESLSRVLVWMIYLNDLPENEGTTEFLEYGKICQPKKGRMVFFPAGITHAHRGNPPYSMDKYIATGWFYLGE